MVLKKKKNTGLERAVRLRRHSSKNSFSYATFQTHTYLFYLNFLSFRPLKKRFTSSHSPMGHAPVVEPCCACDEAKYEVIFEGLWSRHTHPKVGTLDIKVQKVTTSPSFVRHNMFILIILIKEEKFKMGNPGWGGGVIFLLVLLSWIYDCHIWLSYSSSIIYHKKKLRRLKRATFINNNINVI